MALKERFIIVRQVQFEGAGWRSVTEYFSSDTAIYSILRGQRMDGTDYEAQEIIRSLYEVKDIP